MIRANVPHANIPSNMLIVQQIKNSKIAIKPYNDVMALLSSPKLTHGCNVLCPSMNTGHWYDYYIDPILCG